ncbi:hypothetical protein [Aureliella helgolandensis]|uniref:Uncharacterized protein n=1 Tax=Aureliella helgolandensis TaxID=2527968 RepID=A0A518G562_9BACT|nr:hypothetical protein [Aureliella helgolandensis]QDV23735.1 hypothetical protein Q31a_20400 [Aureliella helgolandensis]
MNSTVPPKRSYINEPQGPLLRARRGMLPPHGYRKRAERWRLAADSIAAWCVYCIHATAPILRVGAVY